MDNLSNKQIGGIAAIAAVTIFGCAIYGIKKICKSVTDEAEAQGESAAYNEQAGSSEPNA